MEAAVEPQPAGIPPELLERCMRRKATQKKNVPAAEAPAGNSADKLVLAKLEDQEARERCVRAVIAQHRKQQKAAPKK